MYGPGTGTAPATRAYTAIRLLFIPSLEFSAFCAGGTDLSKSHLPPRSIPRSKFLGCRGVYQRLNARYTDMNANKNSIR